MNKNSYTYTSDYRLLSLLALKGDVLLTSQYGVRTQYLHSTLPETARKWFDLHYQQSGFDGRFQVGYRREGESAIFPLNTLPLLEMEKFLTAMHVSSHMDYYITANSVSGVRRLKDSLFSLHNIVLDIDAHREPDTGYFTRSDIMDDFLFSLKKDVLSDDGFPSPNSIVWTGRGLQLWWAIIPMSYKCLPWYQEICDALISRISQLLSDDENLKPLSVDAAASTNTVGYFRLPGTINTRSSTRVVAEIWQTEQHDTHDMIKWAKKWRASRIEIPCAPLSKDDDFISKYSDAEVFILRDIHTTAFFRLRQLVQLRILRDNDIGEETRNNMCFMVYNSMLPAVGHQKAWDKLIEFNKGFKVPMTEKELHQTIDTTTKKGGYRYTNARLIEFLSITPDEQAAIGMYAPAQPYTPLTQVSGHPSRKAAAKLKKDVRNERIKTLASSGKSVPEIAAELEVSEPTIRSVLNVKARKARIRDEVLAMFNRGAKVEVIAEELKVSRTTVWRLTKNINHVSKSKNLSYI